MKLSKGITALIAACIALGSAAAGLAQSTSVINGTVFADYYYNYKSATASEQDRNAFQLRRVYFTYENNINADLKVRVRFESESNAYGSTSKINPFVKHAYLEWSNLIPKHKLYLGIAETNAFKNAEDLWGYRAVEKTIMDLNKISSSADLGLALKGDLHPNVHHWLTVMNGTGYGAAEGDRYKKVGYALWLTPVKGLIVEGYADYENQDPTDPQTATVMSAGKDYAGSDSYMTLKGMIGLSRPSFSVGLEAFQRTNVESGIENVSTQYDSTAKKYKITQKTAADVAKFGYSLFGSWITPIPRLKVFARYDLFDPNTGDALFTKFDDAKGKLTSGTDDEFTQMFFGLDYVSKGAMHIMPNVIIKNYAAEGKDSDITARLTMWFNFNSGKIITES
ncbi:hypothetical protein JW777_04355 [bacterium]|nr:hypothetical protein [bacterium]